MPIPGAGWRRTLASWHADHDRVAALANALNVQRLRWIGLAVGVLSLLHVMVFGLRLLTATPASATEQAWLQALVLGHAVMCAATLALAWQCRCLHARGGDLPAWPAHLATAMALAFGALFAVIDQLVTPAISPFMLAAMVGGVIIHVRPAVALLLYTTATALFIAFLSATQQDPVILLSNRLNGVTACVLGWIIAVVRWRNFALLTLQQRQLAEANAALSANQIELERLSRHDGLTGLMNRNTFIETARRELRQARRQGVPTSLLLLDLDHFKRINDSYGHPAGDAALKQVAAVLRATVRATDLAARLGGEEFMVLLPATPVDAARLQAERLRIGIAASPAHWENQVLEVTTSIGLAEAPAGSDLDFDQLYVLADRACYQAKQRGRNQVV